MNILKFIPASIILLFLLFILPLPTFAASKPLPFLPEQGGNSIEPTKPAFFLNDAIESIGVYGPEINLGFTTLLAIMFLIGVIKMSYALITKTGMILKGSTGILIGIPLFVLSMRISFILLFTTNGPGVTLLVIDFMNLLKSIGFLLAIGMILIGILMRLFYKFLNHPEYARWSKRLFIGSGVLSLLTAIMPFVIQSL